MQQNYLVLLPDRSEKCMCRCLQVNCGNPSIDPFQSTILDNWTMNNLEINKACRTANIQSSLSADEIMPEQSPELSIFPSAPLEPGSVTLCHPTGEFHNHSGHLPSYVVRDERHPFGRWRWDAGIWKSRSNSGSWKEQHRDLLARPTCAWTSGGHTCWQGWEECKIYCTTDLQPGVSELLLRLPDRFSTASRIHHVRWCSYRCCKSFAQSHKQPARSIPI